MKLIDEALQHVAEKEVKKLIDSLFFSTNIFSPMLFLSAMPNIQARQVSWAEYTLELQVLPATKITDAQKPSGSSYLRAGKNASKTADNEVLSKGQH